MQAYLQFANGEGGPYAPVGMQRALVRRYRLEALGGLDRLGEEQPYAWRVAHEERVLQLHGNFLSALQWHFRLYYPDDALTRYLGRLFYQAEFDALLTRNRIVIHTVRVEFISTTRPDTAPYGYDNSIYSGDLDAGVFV